MADSIRYAKTPKGTDEIGNRRNNLRGKMRTMLILIDPRKSTDELRDQASKLGVPPNFLETLVHDGYIAPAGGAALPAEAAGIPLPDAPPAVDEFARFREAKTFMNESVVNALGIRAFVFTLRLERCANRADLAALGSVVAVLFA